MEGVGAYDEKDLYNNHKILRTIWFSAEDVLRFYDTTLVYTRRKVNREKIASAKIKKQNIRNGGISAIVT